LGFHFKNQIITYLILANLHQSYRFHGFHRDRTLLLFLLLLIQSFLLFQYVFLI